MVIGKSHENGCLGCGYYQFQVCASGHASVQWEYEPGPGGTHTENHGFQTVERKREQQLLVENYRLCSCEGATCCTCRLVPYAIRCGSLREYLVRISCRECWEVFRVLFGVFLKAMLTCCGAWDCNCCWSRALSRTSSATRAFDSQVDVGGGAFQHILYHADPDGGVGVARRAPQRVLHKNWESFMVFERQWLRSSGSFC